MKYDVFISYSRRDYVDCDIPIPDNIIDKLLMLFDKEEISYWIDKKGIYSADKFMDKICDAIDESYLLVFVSTKNSHESDWTPKELMYADNNKHPIIPFDLGTAPKKGRVAFFINDFDKISVKESGEENAFQRLIDSINKKLDELNPNRAIIRQLKLQLEELWNNIKQKERERKLVIKELADLGVEVKDERDYKSEQLVKLRKEIEAKNAELKEKDADLSEKKKRIEELNTSLLSLEGELSKAQAARDVAEKIIAELKEQIKKVVLPKMQSQVKVRNDETESFLKGWQQRLIDKLFFEDEKGQSEEKRVQLDNSLWFDEATYALRYKNFSYPLIEVEGGTFTMGATREQGDDVYDDEKTVHKVTLSTYYMGKTAVPQWLWKAVTGSNPSHWQGDNLPVEQVSWDDCWDFINKLNNITGQHFAFPTEAQWEFAARGGNKSNGYKYSGNNDIDKVAWYGDNSGGQTHEVGIKLANELGLYDMSGNLWEWCGDWKGSYRTKSVIDPIGPISGSIRVIRGGCWKNYAGRCRVAYRSGSSPGIRNTELGLRLALYSLKDEKSQEMELMRM